MTDLIRRIGIFSIGLSLGIVLVAFFFKGKGVEMCYLPNCRVLKDLRSKPFELTENVALHYTINDVAPVFKNGTVNFKESNTQSFPCKTYILEGETTKGKLRIKVENCLNSVSVQQVERVR